MIELLEQLLKINIFEQSENLWRAWWIVKDELVVGRPAKPPAITEQIKPAEAPAEPEYEIKKIKPKPGSPEEPHWNIYKVLPNGKRQIVQTGFVTKQDAEQVLAKQAPAKPAEAPAEPAETVYHGTSIESAKEIRQTGFTQKRTLGMTGQPIKGFVFVTPHKAVAKWYGEQNTQFKGEYDIVKANLKGKLYEIEKPTNEYGAMGIFAKDIGLMKPEEHLLNLPLIAKELKARGYSGIKFKDSVSRKLAYAVLPEMLTVGPTPSPAKSAEVKAEQVAYQQSYLNIPPEEFWGANTMSDLRAYKF